MDNDVVIKVENASKKYCKSLKKSMIHGMTDIGRNMLGLSSHSDRLRRGEFWALKNISLEVKKGETLGLIGSNGSGKTTLMKMINGIFWPDKGRITVKGKVGALIAVGAGFHPSLTGRENIYINGAILGMSKREIDKKFDAIVEFADIGDFLDAPVKHYSSGMFVRLGFAVAVHCEPDILLIDEVLSVGDIDFQNKCLRKFKEFKESRASIVFVSHNLDIVRRICDRVIFLNLGEVKSAGDPDNSLRVYKQFVVNKNLQTKQDISIFNDEEIQIKNVRLTDGEGREKKAFLLDDELFIKIEYQSHQKIEKPTFTIGFYGEDGQCYVGLSTLHDKYQIDCIQGTGKMEIEFKALFMKPGLYRISVGIWDSRGISPYAWHQRAYTLVIEDERKAGNGLYYLPHRWILKKDI